MQEHKKFAEKPKPGVIASYMETAFGQIKSGKPVGRIFGLTGEYSEAIYTLAHFYFEQGRFEDALQFFRLLTMIDVNDRRGLIGSGLCYKNIKDYKRAIQCLGLAYITEPDDARLAVHVVYCLLGSGKKIEAAEMLEKMEIDAGKFSNLDDLSDSLHALRELLLSKN